MTCEQSFLQIRYKITPHFLEDITFMYSIRIHGPQINFKKKLIITPCPHTW